MCGRSSLTQTEKELEKRFNATFYSEDLERYNPLPNFNVAPTHILPALLQGREGHFHPLRWGLIPHWSKSEKVGFSNINAKMETLEEKRTFKPLIDSFRCIIPFSGYFEWQVKGGVKIPHYIFQKESPVFPVAALWTSWKESENSSIDSYTIITRDALPALSHLHGRMPLVLNDEGMKIWLDSEIVGKDSFKIVLNGGPEEETFEFYEVSSAVNSVKNNNKGLIERAEGGGDQLSLF